MRRWLKIVSLSLLALPACKREEAPASRPENAVERAPVSAVQVRFAKVETRRVAPVLELTGTLDAEERSEVAAQTPGVVAKINVDVGSRVKKGDTLAILA